MEVAGISKQVLQDKSSSVQGNIVKTSTHKHYISRKDIESAMWVNYPHLYNFKHEFFRTFIPVSSLSFNMAIINI